MSIETRVMRHKHGKVLFTHELHRTKERLILTDASQTALDQLDEAQSLLEKADRAYENMIAALRARSKDKDDAAMQSLTVSERLLAQAKEALKKVNTESVPDDQPSESEPAKSSSEPKPAPAEPKPQSSSEPQGEDEEKSASADKAEDNQPVGTTLSTRQINEGFDALHERLNILENDLKPFRKTGRLINGAGDFFEGKKRKTRHNDKDAPDSQQDSDSNQDDNPRPPTKVLDKTGQNGADRKGAHRNPRS